MTPEQIYQQLVELAERLGIEVSEKNLRQAGFSVRSGLCKVHGESIFFMDKKAGLAEKIELLAACLAGQPLDEVYMVPALREVVDRNRPRGQSQREEGKEEKKKVQDDASERPESP